MTGFLIVFWAAPVMTAGHLLLAAGATAYILAGTRLEEHDLSRELGPVYGAYQREVRALLPLPRRAGDHSWSFSGDRLRGASIRAQSRRILRRPLVGNAVHDRRRDPAGS